MLRATLCYLPEDSSLPCLHRTSPCYLLLLSRVLLSPVSPLRSCFLQPDATTLLSTLVSCFLHCGHHTIPAPLCYSPEDSVLACLQHYAIPATLFGTHLSRVWNVLLYAIPCYSHEHFSLPRLYLATLCYHLLLSSILLSSVSLPSYSIYLCYSPTHSSPWRLHGLLLPAQCSYNLIVSFPSSPYNFLLGAATVGLHSLCDVLLNPLSAPPAFQHQRTFPLVASTAFSRHAILNFHCSLHQPLISVTIFFTASAISSQHLGTILTYPSSLDAFIKALMRRFVKAMRKWRPPLPRRILP